MTVASMLSAAVAEARGVRQNWLGPEHYLLAILKANTVAAEMLAELGIDYWVARDHIRSIKSVNGRRLRYIEAKGTRTNPAAHEVSGWAEGFAAGRGLRKAAPEDWLLAIIYTDQGAVRSIFDARGVTGVQVVSALRARGVPVPDVEPEVEPEWKGVHTIDVPAIERQAVVDVLNARYPVKPGCRWGFNYWGAGRKTIRFLAEADVDLDGIVAEIRRGVKA